MNDRPFIPLEQVEPQQATDNGVPRRAALQILAGAVGAGFALPSGAEAQHPIHQHLANPSAVEQAQKAAAAASVPEFLDEHQAKTLEALAEAIVPGSTSARVAPFLDQLLAVESPQTQRAFVGALGAFDMAATKKHGKGWVTITAAEQDALLREASAADLKTSALRAQFESLKGWIAGAYYSSEQGMRELGWTGNVFHQELPGCSHPDGHKA
jgi:hypothetical protein